MYNTEVNPTYKLHMLEYRYKTYVAKGLLQLACWIREVIYKKLSCDSPFLIYRLTDHLHQV